MPGKGSAPQRPRSLVGAYYRRAGNFYRGWRRCVIVRFSPRNLLHFFSPLFFLIRALRARLIQPGKEIGEHAETRSLVARWQACRDDRHESRETFVHDDDIHGVDAFACR